MGLGRWLNRRSVGVIGGAVLIRSHTSFGPTHRARPAFLLWALVKRHNILRFAVVLGVGLCIGALVGSKARADVTYKYDPDGRVTQVLDGLGHGVTYGYDPDGNITAVAPFNYPTPTPTATP